MFLVRFLCQKNSCANGNPTLPKFTGNPRKKFRWLNKIYERREHKIILKYINHIAQIVNWMEEKYKIKGNPILT